MIINTMDRNKQKLVKAGEFIKPIFYKKVNNRHYCRIFKGYGIQKDVVDQLLQAECSKVCISLGKKEYWSYLKDWVSYGLCRDLGHGLQYFLPTGEMKGKIDETNR